MDNSNANALAAKASARGNHRASNAAAPKTNPTQPNAIHGSARSIPAQRRAIEGWAIAASHSRSLPAITIQFIAHKPTQATAANTKGNVISNFSITKKSAPTAKPNPAIGSFQRPARSRVVCQ